MRLISGEEISYSVRTSVGPLRIDNFSPEHLQHTSYYIRLGTHYSRITDSIVVDAPGVLDPNGGYLRFAPGEYVRVWSLETFRLDATVLGILGGVSSTPRRALALVAGQFIDPLFPGGTSTQTAPLEFGLKNESQSASAIPVGDIVAKVCFFDVSDSAGIEVIPGSISDKTFEEARLRTERVKAIPTPSTRLRSVTEDS